MGFGKEANVCSLRQRSSTPNRASRCDVWTEREPKDSRNGGAMTSGRDGTLMRQPVYRVPRSAIVTGMPRRIFAAPGVNDDSDECRLFFRQPFLASKSKNSRLQRASSRNTP